ncbi:MAG: hypothetical protein HY459_02485 [Parcubacteria group bacterium]|nr:hypothetical protein [Parcubacteria group bacterium]
MREFSKTSALFLVALAFLPLTPLSTRADYVVSIGEDGVMVRISGTFAQGVPNISANNTASVFTRIPAFHISLSGSNASLLTSLLNDSLRDRSPLAFVNSVFLTATSNETSIQYELSFGVAGILTTRAGVTRVDLSWRSFAILDEVLTGNISINRVLPTYLQPRITLLAEQPPTPGPFQRLDLWYLNDFPTPASRITPSTQDLVLFNFESLSLPLQDWLRTFDLDTGVVRYQTGTGFNLTFIVRITEIEETANFATDAINKINVSIEAPYSTLLTGDELFFETQGEWESKVMVAIVTVSLGLLIATLLFERTLSGRRFAGKRKR